MPRLIYVVRQSSENSVDSMEQQQVGYTVQQYWQQAQPADTHHSTEIHTCELLHRRQVAVQAMCAVTNGELRGAPSTLRVTTVD